MSFKSNQSRREWYRKWVLEQFQLADVNKNGFLNFKEFRDLLNKLNIHYEKQEAKNIFQAADFRKKKLKDKNALDEEEFIKFFNTLDFRPEIEILFETYALKHSGAIDADELKLFLEKEQNMPDVTMEECAGFIKKYQDPDQPTPGFITLRGFEMFLFDETQDIADCRHKKDVNQDMTQPLNQYYIASSHNTYLINDQLIGKSSVEGYINALKKGCRCVEIDVWDGDIVPLVYHGHTLTSRILLSDVLDVIKDYAFCASNYPLILSLEVHCSIPQQIVTAKLIKNKLSEFLYDAKIESEDKLPSPDQLQNKIFIKTKKLKVVDENEELESEDDGDDESDDDVEGDEKGKEDETGKTDSNKLYATVHSSKMAPELSDLVNYFQAKTFKSFEDCKNWKVGEMFSLSEKKAMKLVDCLENQFIECMQNRICRIYPRATRVESSNYSPIPFWNVGCQMVALNYQTYDLPMLLNDARFLETGNCGYVLKPEFLRNPETTLDLEIKKVVRVKIISGQKIPKPRHASEGKVINPYVVVQMVGHVSDEQRHQTRFLLNNGYNPVWKEEFKLTVRVPELAILCFLVYDEHHVRKDGIVGQFALPFSSLTEGYRHVHLLDSNGEKTVPATLFVHIAIDNSFI